MKNLFKLSKRSGIVLSVVALTLAAFVLLPVLFYTNPQMPPGTNVRTVPRTVAPEDVRLLIDDTAWDPGAGSRVVDQVIFDELLAMIDRADQFIFLDLFLWNPWKGSVPEEHRSLSTELARALVEKKRGTRDIDIIVLTDPINRIYGAHEPDFFKDMAKVGIPVVFTDLSRLPDSNTIYSPYWEFAQKYLLKGPAGRWAHRRRFPNPFEKGGAEISAIELGRMLRFKANHRKVAITGSTRTGLEMMVGSLNPADGSSAHSNLALLVRGAPVFEAFRTELAALRWSIQSKRNVIVGATGMASYKAQSAERKALDILSAHPRAAEGPVVEYLTDKAISGTITELLNGCQAGDEIRIAMFYLAQEQVIESLEKAARRGASIRVILDANRDAFGMKKIGVPNRPVAARLMRLSPGRDIRIRWADTHGEQFHTKAMSIKGKTGDDTSFLAGSGNWTRRNISGFNLEADLLVTGAPGLVKEFNLYFDTIWNNSDGLSHSLPYEDWQEKGLKLLAKKLLYRFQESWGAGTF